MVTREELINRRVGRMEALAHDLSRVKPGYELTELEWGQALNLSKALHKFMQMPLGAIQTPDLAQEDKPASEEKPEKPAATEGRKPKTGK